MVPALDTESLQLIQETAVAAAGMDVSKRVSVVATLPDKKRWLLIDKDGNHHQEAVGEPSRSHNLLSVMEAVSFAMFVRAELAGKPIVWLHQVGVTVTDDAERVLNNRASYVFTLTPEFKLLQELAKSLEGKSQVDMLRLLRLHLAESFVSDDVRLNLIASLRNIIRKEQSKVSQGSSSYDATLTSDGITAEQWPEEVLLAVRVYDDSALTDRRTIKCIFEADANTKKFILTPLSQHLDKALIETREAAGELIRHALEDDEIPVFLGSP